MTGVNSGDRELRLVQITELAEYRYVALDQVDELTVSRLARRLRSAVSAQRAGRTAYLENGQLAHVPTS